MTETEHRQRSRVAGMVTSMVDGMVTGINSQMSTDFCPSQNNTVSPTKHQQIQFWQLNSLTREIIGKSPRGCNCRLVEW